MATARNHVGVKSPRGATNFRSKLQPHTAATVQLTKTFKLHEEFGTVSFVYVERASDYWNRDTETEVEINKEEAQKIVDFLTEKFKLSPP